MPSNEVTMFLCFLRTVILLEDFRNVTLIWQTMFRISLASVDQTAHLLTTPPGGQCDVTNVFYRVHQFYFMFRRSGRIQPNLFSFCRVNSAATFVDYLTMCVLNYTYKHLFIHKDMFSSGSVDWTTFLMVVTCLRSKSVASMKLLIYLGEISRRVFEVLFLFFPYFRVNFSTWCVENFSSNLNLAAT